MSEQNRSNKGERPLPAAWAADFIRVASVPDDEADIVPNDEPSTTPNRVPATRGWCWLWNGLELYLKTIRIWIAPLAALVTLDALILSTPLIIQLSLGSSWTLLTSGVAAGATQLLATAFTGMLMIGFPRAESGHRVTLGHLLVSVRKSLFRLILIGFPLALFGIIQYVVSAAILASAFVGLIDALTVIPVFAEIAAPLYGALPGITDFITSCPTELLLWALTLLSLPFWMAAFYAPALVVFGNASATQAMRRSFVACLHNLLPLTIFAAIWYVTTTTLRFASAYVSLDSAMLALCASPLIELAIILPTFICVSYVSYREVFVNQEL